MSCLDGDDLDGLVACCDDRILVANQGRHTVRGRNAVRAKYQPILAAFTTRSTFDIEEFVDLGDTVLVTGTFGVAMQPKDTGEVRKTSGRLFLAYARQKNGEWRLICDVDNNAA